MSDEARKRPGSIAGKALLLLGGLTLYVLSIGPVGRLVSGEHAQPGSEGGSRPHLSSTRLNFLFFPLDS